MVDQTNQTHPDKTTVLDTAVLNTIVATLQNQVIATNNQTQTLKTVLPAVQSTAISASAGTNGDVPAQVYEYLTLIDPHGNTVKVPAYLP